MDDMIKYEVTPTQWEELELDKWLNQKQYIIYKNTIITTLNLKLMRLHLNHLKKKKKNI